MDKKLKKIINNYSLHSLEKLENYLDKNPENLTLSELARISELVNNKKHDTAAYYTDTILLESLYKSLPNINKKEIHILEPSVGVGNFLNIIIEKYKSANKLIIDVVDINSDSLKIAKKLNKYRHIPENVKINFYNADFLLFPITKKYDLAIGNPPFLKINKLENSKKYCSIFNDYISKNISSFFLQKCLSISDYVAIILPKYFLSNPDFKNARRSAEKYSIKEIIDFGEIGFKEVLIETIALFIDTNASITNTISYSLPKNEKNIQSQKQLTDPRFPNWLLYRNDFFNEIAKNLTMSVFDVYRDRTITNRILSDSKSIPVIKSRNISRDGSQILSIDNYDSYVDYNDIKSKKIASYIDRTDVFLTPNMTYYPRVIQKPKGCITNGSVAILELKDNFALNENHLKFLNSSTFTKFYNIARNYSTRSLNIDKNSVQYFGLYEGENYD